MLSIGQSEDHLDFVVRLASWPACAFARSDAVQQQLQQQQQPQPVPDHRATGLQMGKGKKAWRAKCHLVTLSRAAWFGTFGEDHFICKQTVWTCPTQLPHTS